jgi:hypothetical protein
MYRKKPNYLLWLAVAGGAYYFRNQIVAFVQKITKKSI